MSVPYLSSAALAAGVPARFLYWPGRSGRRYLFTRTSGTVVDDFEEGVAIAVKGEQVIWAGDVATLARMPAYAAPRRGTIYLHFLASTVDERQAVIEDLRPGERYRLRLAA